MKFKPITNVFLALTVAVLFPAVAFAQDQMVKLSGEKITLAEAFDQIEQQTDLSIDYDQKDIYEHATYDKFCRNNLKFKSGNFQLITSYLLPFKKMTRTRMFFLRKKIKAGKKNFYEYFVALPKNFDKNKKYDCLITTDGILWMRFLRLDDLIQNELKLNMIVVGILQKNQNKELAYNMYFAEFIVNTFSKKLKEEYKIKDMIFP